jgi:hypothetical protein
VWLPHLRCFFVFLFAGWVLCGSKAWQILRPPACADRDISSYLDFIISKLTFAHARFLEHGMADRVGQVVYLLGLPEAVHAHIWTHLHMLHWGLYWARTVTKVVQYSLSHMDTPVWA